MWSTWRLMPAARTAFLSSTIKNGTLVDDRTRMTSPESDYEPVKQDANETFVYDTTINLAAPRSIVAFQHDPENRRLAWELGNLKLERTVYRLLHQRQENRFSDLRRVGQGTTRLHRNLRSDEHVEKCTRAAIS